MIESTLSKQLRDDINDHFDGDVHINLLPDMRRTGKKPYDFYFLKDGKFYAYELKVENGKSIAFNKIKPHQPGFLKDVIRQGGYAYLLICFPKKKQIFILSPFDWDRVLKKSFKKSVSYDYLIDYYTCIERRKIKGKTRWDMEELFENVI